MVASFLSVSPPHREDIKALIRKRFGTISAAAKILGVEPESISGLLESPVKSIKLEKRIAELLEIPPQSLWPDRWTAYGQPIPRSVRLENLQRKTA